MALCTAPAWAQNKPKPGARPAGLPIPIILGAAIGGLAIGGVLGALMRKPAADPNAKPVETGPGPAFEGAPMPLAILDTREAITNANAAFTRTFGLNNPVGFSFPQLLHPDEMAKNRTQLQEVFGGDLNQFQTDTRFFRPDGLMLHGTLSVQRQGDKRKPESVLVAVEDTTRRVEAEQELTGAREAILSLYDVIAGDKTRNLDSKMRSLLSMGCNRFDLPIGALGRYNGEEYETLFVQSNDRRVRPAMSLPRNGNGSIESHLLGLGQVPAEANWRDYPYLALDEPVTYLGAPVIVGGDLFGMLSFSRIEPREKPMAAGDVELLQLMAEWVGGEIERENSRISLEAKQKELLEVNAKLEALATYDALTEVRNRRAFNEKLDEEWARAKRYGTALSMVLFDVDKFKSYNDTFGHPAGDQVLRKVAQILSASVRGTDFLARYGGEEFVLLLPNTDWDGAMILAERLRRKIEEGNWKERAVTASLGVSSITPTMDVAQALTQAADNALYYSKENGRNRVTHCKDLPENTFKLQETNT